MIVVRQWKVEKRLQNWQEHRRGRRRDVGEGGNGNGKGEVVYAGVVKQVDRSWR